MLYKGKRKRINREIILKNNFNLSFALHLRLKHLKFDQIEPNRIRDRGLCSLQYIHTSPT